MTEKAKYDFSENIERVNELLTQKFEACNEEQKQIRAKLRKLHFYCNQENAKLHIKQFKVAS